MFLRNLWELLRVNSQETFYSSTSEPYGTAATIKAMDGTNFTTLCNSHFTNYTSNTNYQTACRALLNPFYGLTARVGTGTTSADPNDYCLETDVTSSFSATSTAVSYSTNEAGHFVITILWTGTNNTASDIVITEFGATKIMGDKTNTSSSAGTNLSLRTVLVARHILTTPVTVHAGEGTTITVQIELY